MASVTDRNDLKVDVAIAVAAFAASLGMLAAGDSDAGGGTLAVAVALTALTSLPLIVRRRAPVAVFVMTAVASAALQLVGAAADGPPIGATLALYWMAAAGDGSRARARLTLGLTAALLAAHAVAGGLERGAFPGPELLFGTLLWGGAWLAGDRTRLRRERMAELEERALRAEREAERERRLATAEVRTGIARDLHDSAGHAINVILVHAGMGRLESDRDPARAREAFETIEEVARETVTEIDQMVRVLRDDAPPGQGPADVEPPAGLAALSGLVERHRAAGMDVTTTVRGQPGQVPSGVDRGAYRILQEALTNAARHGDGRAGVEIAFSSSALDLSVVNPLARDAATANTGGGHGLTGMRERAALLGGSVEAGAGDGSFRVHVRIPLAERRA